MHIPVLLQETLNGLQVGPDDIVLDATVGFGGHSSEIIKRLTGSGMLIGLDTDPKAVEHCRKKFADYSNVHIFHLSYREFPEALKDLNINKISKVVADLGFSSYQLDLSGRGFSHLKEEPLDMRMKLPGGTLSKENKDSEPASFILNTYSKEELIYTFKEYGELYNCHKLVENILEYRQEKRIGTTGQLVELIKKSFFFQNSRKKFLKTCALVFQALRIEVNQELANLLLFLEKLPNYLSGKSRVAIISFHSLEDRIVKKYISEHKKNKEHVSKYQPKQKEQEQEQTQTRIKAINKRVIQATQEEITNNIRAKSAKLRVFEISG
jgi:16S rRNA (cytosine1402-N4)-methyltransferase